MDGKSFSYFLHQHGFITPDGKVARQCCGQDSCCGEIRIPLDADELDVLAHEWAEVVNRIMTAAASTSGV